MSYANVTKAADENGEFTFWDAIGKTFRVMEARRIKRKSSGSVNRGISNPLLTILFLTCIFSFVVQFVVVGSTPGHVKLKSDSECTVAISFFKEDDLDYPTDALACGELCAKTSGSSHLFMWPKSDDAEGCLCCKRLGLPMGKVLLEYTRENPAYDLYLIWFAENEDADSTAFAPIKQFFLIVAVTVSVCSALLVLWYGCSETRLSVRAQITILTVVYGVWIAVAHCEHQPRTLAWTPTKEFPWSPSKYMFELTLYYIEALVMILVFDFFVSNFQKCLVTSSDDLVKCWYGIEVVHGPEIIPDQYSPGSYRLTMSCSYRPSGLWKCWVPRQEFKYDGCCNEFCRPHGLGEWHDSSYSGENMKGYFVDGELGGHFTSRETGTGIVFMQTATAYVASRTDCPKGQLSSQSCFYRRGPPRCGIAMVECSVAGGFYPFYPRVASEIGWINEDDIGGMLKYYLADETCATECLGGDGFKLCGTPSQPREKEALVFVHGWMCELSTALEKIALVTMLGKMPPHVVPIIFGWSSGGVLSYFTIKNHSIEYKEDFCSFFTELGHHFRKVHVFCHSMGNQVWCQNFPEIAGRCFLRAYGPAGKRNFAPRSNAWDTRLQMENLILLNAEVTVDELMQCSDAIYGYTKHVTIYVDKKDLANMASQAFQKMMPWSWQRGWRSREDVHKTMVVGLQQSSYNLAVTTSGTELRGPVITEVCGEESDEDVEAPGAAAQSREILMDLFDVIDCTNLDNNAGLSRHNYYAINSLMVEDICGLVGTGTPAKERAHLVRREHGIFDFLAAPAVVTM